MGLNYLLLSVHRPSGGEMRGLGPFRGRRRRSSFTRDRIDDVHAAILIGESHGRLPGRTGRVLDRGVWIRRVNILVKIVRAVVLLHPVGHVGLPVIGHGGRRIPEAEHLVRRRRRVQLALLRDLPLLPHHPLEILQEVARRRLIGRGEFLGRREPGAVGSPGRRRFPLRQGWTTGFLLRRQIERDLLAGAGLRLGRRRRFLNGHPALRLRTGGGFQLGQIRRRRVMTASLLHSAASNGVHVRIRPDRLDRVVVGLVTRVHRFDLGVLPAEALGIDVLLLLLLLGAVSRRRHERWRRREVGRARDTGRRARRRSWIGTMRGGYGIGGAVRVMRRRVRVVILTVLDRVAVQRDTVRVHVHLIGLRPGIVRRGAFGGYRVRGGGLLRSGATYRSGFADQRTGRWR